MNDNKNKFHNFIGLARRAGKVVLGSEAIEDAIRSKKPFCDCCSGRCQGTAKRLMDKCKSYNVPYGFGTKQSLGKITVLARRLVLQLPTAALQTSLYA